MARKKQKNAPRLQLGSIVKLDVCDPWGEPAGPHFAVVLTRQKDIDAGRDLRAAVITTSFHYPLPDGWFVLPHTPGKPGGHEYTGLWEASVVKGTWLHPHPIPQESVVFNGKRAPVKVVRQLQMWLSYQREKARKARTKKTP